MINEILSNTVGYLWVILPFLILLFAFLLKKKQWYIKYPVLICSYFILDFIILILLRIIENKKEMESINFFTALFLEFNPIIFILILIYLIIKDIFSRLGEKVETIIESKIKK